MLLDGVSYLDGGVSDAIPVQEAARRGAQTIVVIRTVPSQMFYTPQWFKRMERWLGESSLQPLVNLVHHHETTYRAIQQFIEKPPGKLRIFEIYPQRPLRSMALGSRLPALLEDYKTGRQCGRYFWRRWVNCWLTGRRCCAIRRVLPARRRWWCRRYRWPMRHLRQRSSPRRRRMTPALIMRIWHEPPFYRYPLPL